ncbi:MAG TPA: glycosyltransferase family 2 protein [Anaeromyxobacter sp.]|nr:glycosyltransferase family 2 protein [Anaeromyxobacter sp.]
MSEVTELVSIITPCFNSRIFLEETIRSVLAQTYANWEMIIVDDCSTDGSFQVASAWAARDRRITALQLPTNQGAGPARNTAIQAARGRYLAFLDSDDLWDPDKLQRQLAFMSERDHGFTYSEYRVISEEGLLLGKPGPFPASLSYWDMLKDYPGCLTVIVDRKVFPTVYFPPVRRNQDGAAWLALLRGGRHRAHKLDAELASYRTVRTSLTNNKLKSARAVWYVMREVEHLRWPVAAYFLGQYAIRGARKHLVTRAKQR